MEYNDYERYFEYEKSIYSIVQMSYKKKKEPILLGFESCSIRSLSNHKALILANGCI